MTAKKSCRCRELGLCEHLLFLFDILLSQSVSDCQQLETVRSLAHNDNLFWMEVGKIAPTGEGELWMQADDAVIAQNLHETILRLCHVSCSDYILLCLL